MRLITSDSPRPLRLLAFGPDGLVAAARGVFGANGLPDDDALEAWDPATGTRRFAVGVPSYRPLTCVVGSAGRFLVAAFPGGGGPYLRAVSAGGQVSAVEAFEWQPIGLSTAAGRVLAGTFSGNLWDRLECLTDEGETFRPLWRTKHADMVRLRWPALSPDGAVAAVAVSDQSNRPTQHITLLDGNTGAELRRIDLDPADPVRQLAFTADGNTLAARFDSRTVRLFDAKTGAPKGELTHKGRPYVTAVAAHPGGPVACARTDGAVTFWNPDTRQILRTLDWKAGGLVSLAFRPDGALGAAGTADGTIVVWDVDV